MPYIVDDFKSLQRGVVYSRAACLHSISAVHSSLLKAKLVNKQGQAFSNTCKSHPICLDSPGLKARPLYAELYSDVLTDKFSAFGRPTANN